MISEMAISERLNTHLGGLKFLDTVQADILSFIGDCAKGADGDTVVLMTVSIGTKNQKPIRHCCCRKGGNKEVLLYYPQGHHEG
uniref:Uncharacterized protein n=1 Tax=Tanacetum cinerariifolium TaxID=118510 RepID=A0A6L2K8F8_TANCI|nr:hypothetical protein [Tanacetum cinerariifolium]